MDQEGIQKKLEELIEISEDPYYDQYLKQMMKDLESGKASPVQIQKEIDRTFALYQKRMMQKKKQGQEQKPEQRAVPAKRKNIEFKIGAEVFSVIGAVLCLTAFVTIGFNFLSGVLQGICLMLAPMVLILISELLIRRMNEKIGEIITGIGTGCLYLSVVINYMGLKNMGLIVATLLLLLVSLISIILSHKRDLSAYRMINLCAHTFSSVLLYEYAKLTYENTIYCSAFLAAALIVLNLIYFERYYLLGNEKKKESTKEFHTGFLILFGIALGIFLVTLCESSSYIIESMAVLISVIFYLLWGKDKKRFIQVYFLAGVFVFMNGLSDVSLESALSLAIVFALIRLLSIKNRELDVLDCILEVIIVIQAIFLNRTWYELLLLAAILFSACTIRRLTRFHEITITVGLIILAAIGVKSAFMAPLVITIAFLGTLFFHFVPWTRMESQKIYNIMNVSIAGCVSLMAIFFEHWYSNLFVLVIGIAMILVVFGNEFELCIKRRYLILSGYIVYMVLTIDTSVIATTVLMVIAVLLIVFGFKTKDTVYRITGLVLAGLVCVKLLIFDFANLETLQRAILFLIAGLIALGISFLYIGLEKKEDQLELAKKTEEEYKEEEDAREPGKVEMKFEEEIDKQ